MYTETYDSNNGTIQMIYSDNNTFALRFGGEEICTGECGGAGPSNIKPCEGISFQTAMESVVQALGSMMFDNGDRIDH